MLEALLITICVLLTGILIVSIMTWRNTRNEFQLSSQITPDAKAKWLKKRRD